MATDWFLDKRWVPLLFIFTAISLCVLFQAFSLIESEYGVSPFASPEEMVSEQAIDKLALLSFLAQLKFAIMEDEGLAAKQRNAHFHKHNSDLNICSHFLEFYDSIIHIPLPTLLLVPILIFILPFSSLLTEAKNNGVFGRRMSAIGMLMKVSMRGKKVSYQQHWSRQNCQNDWLIATGYIKHLLIRGLIETTLTQSMVNFSAWQHFYVRIILA